MRVQLTVNLVTKMMYEQSKRIYHKVVIAWVVDKDNTTLAC